MKTFRITIGRKQIKYATDMLRYDGAYKVEDAGNDQLYIYLHHFTEGRWQSFNLNPPRQIINEYGGKEQNIIDASNGFQQGLVFVQEVFKNELQQRLTEHSLNKGI